MISLKYCHPCVPNWKEICNKYERKNQNVIKTHRHGKSIRTNYPDLLAILSRKEIPYYGKCVYCEKPLDEKETLDHFRPKNEIKNKDGNLVRNSGYYWHAYNIENLLPCCHKCNDLKGSKFPVKNHYAINASEESKEELLILNPTIDSIKEHIMFEPQTGLLIGVTEKARITIDDVFNLQRLSVTRKEVYRETKNKLLLLILKLHEEIEDIVSIKWLLEYIIDTIEGKQKYCMAARSSLSDHCAKKYEHTIDYEALTSILVPAKKILKKNKENELLARLEKICKEIELHQIECYTTKEP